MGRAHSLNKDRGEEEEIPYEILAEKPEGNRPLGKTRQR
jgi:hypothetical protein